MLNALLAERGLPRYDSGAQARSAMGVLKARSKASFGLEAQTFKVASEVVAEYAAAAPRGASEAEILARVQRDYPKLTSHLLGRCKTAWRAKPASYPALAPFRGAALAGLGAPPASPRYLGGWDARRALAGALGPELARGVQHAKIPLRLPLLDKLVGDLGGRTPLRSRNLLMVSHLLGTTFPLVLALRAAGATTGNTTIVGTPYGTNQAVREAISAEGFDVRVPELSVSAYRAAVTRAIDDAVARHRRNHFPIVVMDDGGLVAEILHSNPKYRDVIDAFKIVEQTTRGITAAEQRELRTAVVNVARSRSKQLEGSFIGRAVAGKLVQGLRRVGQEDLRGKRVALVGYGTIGVAIARELRRLGATVTVVDSSPEKLAAARRASFKVAASEDGRAAALAGADVVVGATGVRSLGLEDLRRLKHGAVVASASSKQVEIDMEALRGAAASRTLVAASSPLVKLPNARYRLGRKEITLLGDGWPINFDGDVEDIPSHHIQLTRALMFAGALQAASIYGNRNETKGVIPFDAKTDRDLLAAFKRALRGAPRGRAANAIGDPDRWQESLLAIATRFQ